MGKVQCYEACISKSGNIIGYKDNLIEIDILEAEKEIQEKKDKFGKCYLFFWRDVPGFKPNTVVQLRSTFGDFERNPVEYGVCMFKTWNGSVIYE